MPSSREAIPAAECVALAASNCEAPAGWSWHFDDECRPYLRRNPDAE